MPDSEVQSKGFLTIGSVGVNAADPGFFSEKAFYHCLLMIRSI